MTSKNPTKSLPSDYGLQLPTSFYCNTKGAPQHYVGTPLLKNTQSIPYFLLDLFAVFLLAGFFAALFTGFLAGFLTGFFLAGILDHHLLIKVMKNPLKK